MAIANPGTDDINILAVDAFAGSYIQHAEVSDTPTAYPSKIGRLVVPFTLRSTHTLAEFSAAAAAWTLPGEESEISRSMPPIDVLKGRGVHRFIGITISPITTYGLSGKFIEEDGSLSHYYACSHQWRLSLGSLTCFDEVPELALCVCLSLSHILGNMGTAAAIISSPLHDRLVMEPLAPRRQASFRWPDTDVLSSIPVDTEALLPASFTRPPEGSTYLEEGWCGPSAQSFLTLSEWSEHFLTVREEEAEQWRRWHHARCLSILELTQGAAISVKDIPELPNGESTSRIITRHLDLEPLEASINRLNCGVHATFQSKRSRGCRLTFDTGLPSIILTSNGSFDSSPFPRTAEMQAHLLQVILLAASYPKCIACPGVVDTSPVNASL